MPSSEEVRQHNLSHVPYRNWCPHCIAGRGKAKPHLRGSGQHREVPVIGMDFFYFVKGQEQGPPTIALGDSEIGMLRARVLVSKGVTEEGVKTVTAFIDLLIYKKIAIKADNRPAITALRQESIRQFPYEVVKEMPPKYDSQSNG